MAQLRWTDENLLPMKFGPNDPPFMSAEIERLFSGVPTSDSTATPPYGLDAYWDAVDKYQERMRKLKFCAEGGAVPVIVFDDGPSIPGLCSEDKRFALWNLSDHKIEHVVLSVLWRPSQYGKSGPDLWSDEDGEQLADLMIRVVPMPGTINMATFFGIVRGRSVLLLPDLGALDGVGLEARVLLRRPIRRVEMPEFQLRCTWGFPVPI